MNQSHFIVIFLSVFSVAGSFEKVFSGKVKPKPKWKLKDSLYVPEISSVQTFLPKDRKMKPVVNIPKYETARLKRSVEASLRTNITELMVANSSLKEISQAVDENYEKQFPSGDSDMPNSLAWQLNLNVSSYKNQLNVPSKNPLDIVDDSDIKNDKDKLDMAIYVSGKGPKLFTAWSSVEDFIKSLFGNVDQKLISENRVDLGIKNNLNAIDNNAEHDKTVEVLPTERNEIFGNTTETLRNKEAKLLGLLNLIRRTTPPTSLRTSESNIHGSEVFVSTKQHSLNKTPLETNTESPLRGAIPTTDHSKDELVIENDVINKNITLNSLSHVFEDSVAGAEHSFTVTVESAVSDQPKKTVTENFIQLEPEQGEETKHECLSCEPKSITTIDEIDFEVTDVPQVPTVPLTSDISESQQSTFTDAELEKYCMALVNRLGKALKMSDSFSEFGSGDLDINEASTETSVLSNQVTNQTSEPTRTQNFGFFANLISSIMGRFSNEDTKENPALINETVSEPEITIKNQSTRFGFLNFRNSRADNLGFPQGGSALNETDIFSTNEDTKNLPSITDCEQFFRNNENTKMFPKPNLMDVISDPHIQLEDFENATMSPKLKEQNMQFLSDLLKTGINQTSIPDISTDESRDPLILNEASTIPTFTQDNENKENAQEQFNAFSTELESQVLPITDRHVLEENFPADKERRDEFIPTSSEAMTNEITEPIEISEKNFNAFFGSGDRSLDTTITPQERVFGIFDIGSGTGRIDISGDENEAPKFVTENLLGEFEDQDSELSESKTPLTDNLGNDMSSFEVFEGSGIARDLILTTESLPFNNEYDVDCKDECAPEFKKLNVTTFDFDCEDDCGDEYENVNGNTVDSSDLPVFEIDALNEKLNESESNESVSKTLKNKENVDISASTDFPVEDELHKTENESRSFGTIFSAGSGGGGLFDNGGQIILEEEPIFVPAVPGRGARFEDSEIAEDDLSKSETRKETPTEFTPYRLKDYGLTTGISTKDGMLSRFPERRGRLDEHENPIEEQNIKIGEKSESEQNIATSSLPSSGLNEPNTHAVTDSLPESSSVATTLKSIIPRPTQPQYRHCTSASECSQALNERCVFVNSASVCTCGRSFIRHRETRICEAKVELKTTLKLPREEFHADLRNPDSERFKLMKQRAEETMWLLLSEDPELLDNIADIQVAGFSEGSVVIKYKVILATEKNESISDLVDLVNSEINEAFQNETLMKSIPLDVHDAALLNISNAINACSSSELNYCSQNAICEQDETSVGGFYCRCKEDYEDLSNNTKYAGEVCEATCLPNYCSEHGVCHINEKIGRHCSCSGWYFGKRCHVSGILIIAGISGSNILLVIIVVVLLVFCKKRRLRSNSYGDGRRYLGNLELGSNLELPPSKIGDVVALEDNVGIKTAKFSCISTPLGHAQLPTIRIINASMNSSGSFDSTFDKTPSPVYANYEGGPHATSTL